MPGDGPTVSLSFANNFWGKEDAGVAPLLDRMAGAKLTGDELKSFYATRAAIEDEYARKLLSLARKPLGSAEQGTLRMSLDVVRGETESMAKQHATIAAQMKTELEEPLAAFAGGLKERRKIVQGGAEKLLKTKVGQTAVVTKARDKFEQDCLKIKGYLAQGHMVMGQEERKNKAKLEKTQIQMSTNSHEYEAAVKILEETTGKWNREWKAACDKFQDLEEERIDFFKSSLWSFANIASTVCVSDDQSCEKIRLSLEDCEVEKDIMSFIRECGTGQEIPDPPKYINFCRGDAEIEEDYSVAQFQRSTNPTFRSSSPQPSVQEDLRASTGSAPSYADATRPETTRARSSYGAGGSSFGDNGPRSSFGDASGPHSGSRGSFGAPTHSDLSAATRSDVGAPAQSELSSYSAPRIAPPSERSQPSPTRPGSSGSLQHSDYTNPTSISDVEPEEEDKKKRGFFSSPFRRRSQKKLETSNTWGPTRESPSKAPFGRWQKQASPDPDPVDPRADYQLGIGNNVFDVAHPTRPQASPQSAPGMDPIAQALAELKGVTKQSASRTSADRHYGMGTPAPDSRGRQDPALGRTPPPAYQSSLLGAPQPAHTKREMQKTTERFVNQKRDMFQAAPAPRATSPNPQHRSASPNPYAGRSQSISPQKTFMRAASPNPSYSQHHQQPRSASPNPGYGRQDMPRAASPNPAFSRQPADMSLQLAPGQRPQSAYYDARGYGDQALATRTRSQSQGTQRRFTKDGRPILHYSRAMYMYQAAIPEELSFGKGDILAVLRLQDDGWWEAEIVGKDGHPGLVPSNYLKNC